MGDFWAQPQVHLAPGVRDHKAGFGVQPRNTFPNPFAFERMH
jgi:hypothetical protein